MLNESDDIVSKLYALRAGLSLISQEKDKMDSDIALAENKKNIDVTAATEKKNRMLIVAENDRHEAQLMAEKSRDDQCEASRISNSEARKKLEKIAEYSQRKSEIAKNRYIQNSHNCLGVMNAEKTKLSYNVKKFLLTFLFQLVAVVFQVGIVVALIVVFFCIKSSARVYVYVGLFSSNLLLGLSEIIYVSAKRKKDDEKLCCGDGWLIGLQIFTAVIAIPTCVMELFAVKSYVYAWGAFVGVAACSVMTVIEFVLDGFSQYSSNLKR